MSRIVALVLIGVFAGTTACGDDDATNAAGFCSKLTGNIGGVAATAQCSAEVLPSYTVLTCQISSGGFGYIFAADMIGSRGWADMVESPTGQRVRVQVDLLANGFLLTLNPFGAPTQYTFSCS